MRALKIQQYRPIDAVHDKLFILILQICFLIWARAIKMAFSAKMRHWINILFQPLCYYCAWYIAVILSAHNQPWQATSVAFVVVIVQVIHQVFKKNNKNALAAAFLLALIGIAIDSIYVSTNIISFNSNSFSPYFAPAWMMVIWFSFSITFFSIRRLFDARPILLAFFSLIGFPLAYYAGVMMGAAHFDNMIFSMLIIGLTWTVLLPWYTWLAKRIFKSLLYEWKIKSKP